MRITLASFRIEISGERNPTPPQYYKAVEVVLLIAGKNLDSGKVERAIALSKNKYCSVYNSLRPDMALNVRYVLEEKDPPGADKKSGKRWRPFSTAKSLFDQTGIAPSGFPVHTKNPDGAIHLWLCRSRFVLCPFFRRAVIVLHFFMA